uniref:Uncharacterized protein n=1 Tax=Arundo donax TaxID=35708 RepID=A0A0A9F972_ARUDO
MAYYTQRLIKRTYILVYYTQRSIKYSLKITCSHSMSFFCAPSKS